jgi:hypothetical protein
MRAAGLLAATFVLAACGAGSSRTAGSPRTAALGAPRVVPGSLEAAPLLGDLPKLASGAGAGPLAIVSSGPISEGERVGAFVEVPRDACLLAYGRASPSVEDIDLAAFAEEGNAIAVDERPDPRPTILVCPPHPDRVYVAIHAASGDGLAVIAAQLVPVENAAAVARVAGARGAFGGAPKTTEAWPGLDARVRAHRATLGGAWEEQRRVAVAVDTRAASAVAFSVEEGGCTDALVVPDEDVAILDIEVLDGDGRLLARARDDGAVRSATVCSPVAISGSLQVRPHVGRGLAAVVLSRTTGDALRELFVRPDVAWAAPALPLEATRAARNVALGKAGYAAATAAPSGQLQLGRRITLPIELAKDGCTRVDVVGGAPLAHIEAAVWDDAGGLLARDEGSAAATLFACGSGKARVDLGTHGRPGPYAVLVRPETWRDPAFRAHPLAAGRMLGRAALGPVSLFEGQVLAVRRAQLEPARHDVRAASIPPGRCLIAAFGAEGEGTGLEVRLFDAVSGEELDRSHGQHDAAVRGCAGKTTRSVRVEARATAGKLAAVIGERLVSSP